MAGIVFIVMTIIHNIINIKWYKTIKKGVYSRKRKIAIAVNFALASDIVSILLTGIINSRYLFHTGIHITGIGQIHAVLAVVGFVLIAFHVMFHAFGRVQKKYRALPVTLAIRTLMMMWTQFPERPCCSMRKRSLWETVR